MKVAGLWGKAGESALLLHMKRGMLHRCEWVSANTREKLFGSPTDILLDTHGYGCPGFSRLGLRDRPRRTPISTLLRRDAALLGNEEKKA